MAVGMFAMCAALELQEPNHVAAPGILAALNGPSEAISRLLRQSKVNIPRVRITRLTVLASIYQFARFACVLAACAMLATSVHRFGDLLHKGDRCCPRA